MLFFRQGVVVLKVEGEGPLCKRSFIQPGTRPQRASGLGLRVLGEGSLYEGPCVPLRIGATMTKLRRQVNTYTISIYIYMYICIYVCMYVYIYRDYTCSGDTGIP